MARLYKQFLNIRSGTAPKPVPLAPARPNGIGTKFGRSGGHKKFSAQGLPQAVYLSKYIPLAVTVLTIGFVIVVSGCGGKKAEAKKGAERIEQAVKADADDMASGEEGLDIKHRVQHFKLEGFKKDGATQCSIEGDFAKIVGSDIILDSIRGTNDDKKISVTFAADRGVYNRQSGCTELEGNVVVKTTDGGQVTMDSAYWNAEEEKIETDSAVTIIHSGITLKGEGALVKPKEKWAILKRAIKATDSTERVIVCEGPLEVDYEKHKAVFNNKVEITDKEGTVYANQVVAYFDPESKTIDKIEWIGDVRAVY